MKMTMIMNILEILKGSLASLLLGAIGGGIIGAGISFIVWAFK